MLRPRISLAMVAKIRLLEAALSPPSALELDDDGAVALERVVDPVGGSDAAGARLVLHHDGRIAGNILAEMARHEPRRDVIDAAGRGADDHGHLPVLVELLDRLRTHCVDCGTYEKAAGDRQRGAMPDHGNAASRWP